MDHPLLVGIDPGTKTGVAVWDTVNLEWWLISTKTQTEVYEMLRELSQNYKLYLRIEEPSKGWYGKNAHKRLQGAGSVKRDAKIWKENCIQNNWPYQMVKPVKGMTKSSLTKETWQKITGYTGRTSNHARDAAMLVFNITQERIKHMRWEPEHDQKHLG